MRNISLTLSELVILLKIFAVITAVLTGSGFLIQSKIMHASVLSSIWRSLSSALTLSAILFGFFCKTAWKHPRIGKLVNRPLLHGVWIGSLNSDYQEKKIEDGNEFVAERLKLPIVFVIRQTYLTLSIMSYTKTQEGESKLEAILHFVESDSTRLKYLFELKRKYKGINRLTAGAGDLKLVSDGQKLEGEYWTSNPTYGELSLQRVSEDCSGIHRFEDVENKWPHHIKN